MEGVPFLALHGVKVTAAIVMLAAGFGVWRYLRRPARRARQRRNEIAFPPPARLSDLTHGDEVTLEGKLVADQSLDLGAHDAVAVACAVAMPGQPGEIRHTAAGGALAVEIGDRLIPVEGACELRAGSREVYPRLAYVFEDDLGIERDVFGIERERDRATALLALRSGDLVRARGRVEAMASSRESGYRESAPDWRMTATDDAAIVLWHPPAPRVRGTTIGGAIWRAIWVGGLTFALILGAARVSFSIASEADDPSVQMRFADVASLSPWMRDRAVWRYTDALERMDPTVERGRAIAGLYELHDRCGRAARALYARQDLRAAAATADRCQSAEGERIAIGSFILMGELGEAARRVAKTQQGNNGKRGALALTLRAGLWQEARDLLADAAHGPVSTCLDAWLADKTGERPADEPAWRASHECESLRADQLEVQKRLEFLGDDALAALGGGPRYLVALEAALQRGDLGGDSSTDDGDIEILAHLSGPGEAATSSPDAPTAEQIARRVGRQSHRIVREVAGFFAKNLGYRRFRQPLGLLVAVGEAAEAQRIRAWEVLPAQLARAMLAALEGEHDEASRLEDEARATLDAMATKLSEDEMRQHGPAALRTLGGLTTLVAGDIPSPGSLEDVSYDLGMLADRRRACAANETESSSPEEMLDVYDEVCRGEPRALIDEQTARAYSGLDVRYMLLAIAPILGDAPALAESPATAPLLPYLSVPIDVPSAYALATQMWMIYDALGHDAAAGVWRERSRFLREALLRRESAVPLALLDSLYW